MRMPVVLVGLLMTTELHYLAAVSMAVSISLTAHRIEHTEMFFSLHRICGLGVAGSYSKT